AERADLRHVRSHDAVAGLRDPLDVLERAERLDAKAQEGEPELVADGDDLDHVLAELRFRTVNRVTRLAGELELTARLEGDRRLSPLEGDHVLALEARRPAETVGELLEHR